MSWMNLNMFSAYVIPVAVIAIVVFGFVRRVPVFDTFLSEPKKACLFPFYFAVFSGADCRRYYAECLWCVGTAYQFFGSRDQCFGISL